MYNSVILPLAKQDIQETARWYNMKKSGLGKRFVQHVRKKVKYIERNPKSIAIRYDTIRTAILDVFPYMIHFYIDEENKKVIMQYLALIRIH